MSLESAESGSEGRRAGARALAAMKRGNGLTVAMGVADGVASRREGSEADANRRATLLIVKIHVSKTLKMSSLLVYLQQTLGSEMRRQINDQQSYMARNETCKKGARMG